MINPLDSRVLVECVKRPSCAIEIAIEIYGNTDHYQDRNISKLLNRLRSFGFVEEVDYVKYKVKEYCKRKKAKHFYVTDENLMKLANNISKQYSRQKLNKIQIGLLKKVFSNRNEFVKMIENYIAFSSVNEKKTKR